MLQGLVRNITDKRWREVFLLTTGMLDSADALLRLMKMRIDELITEDKKLQEFLVWINQKEKLFHNANFGYKLAAIRIFYLSLVNSFLDFGRQDIYVDRGNNYNLRPYQEDDTIGFGIKVDIDFIYVLDIKFCQAIFRIPNQCIHEIKLDELLTKQIEAVRKIEISRESEISESSYILAYNESIEVCDILNNESSLKLKNKLKFIREKFLPKYTGRELESMRVAKASKAEFLNWVKEMRVVMIEHRNIGHDWQFSDSQKERLQQYYDANKLLVDCLNSDCYVSREVRQEIEETLLLPIAEIETRKRMKDEG
jgi:predicted NACHT family NTPase